MESYLRASYFCVGASGISVLLLAFSLFINVNSLNNFEMSSAGSQYLYYIPSTEQTTKEFFKPQVLSEDEIEKNDKQRAIEKSSFSQLLMEMDKNQSKNVSSTNQSSFRSEVSEPNEEIQEEVAMVEEIINDSLVSDEKNEQISSVGQGNAPQAVDTTILQLLIPIGKKFEAWLHTSESIQQLESELKNSKTLLDDSTATQQMVNTQILSLLDSMKKVERKSDIELSKLALFHVIEEMRSIDKKEYSSIIFEVFSQVLKTIQQVYKNPQASINEVKAAIRQGEDALEEIKGSKEGGIK